MTQDILQADWIAAEFDGSCLKVWPMHGEDPLTFLACPTGPAGIVADLVSLISSWLAAEPLPVVLSGDTTVAPVTVPCKPLELQPQVDAERHKRVVIHALPGLRQASPCALMQAAVVRIAGFLSLNPNWDGVICLPGMNTHWAQVSAGEIVSFQSFSSLAMRDALGDLPALSSAFDEDDWDRDALAEAVSDAMSRPERLAARISEIQADIRLNNAGAAVTQGRLTGLLIGAELAAARPYWLGQNIALVGDDAQSAPYAAALGQQGLSATIADVKRMTLAGLIAARKRTAG